MSIICFINVYGGDALARICQTGGFMISVSLKPVSGAVA